MLEYERVRRHWFPRFPALRRLRTPRSPRLSPAQGPRQANLIHQDRADFPLVTAAGPGFVICSPLKRPAQGAAGCRRAKTGDKTCAQAPAELARHPVLTYPIAAE